MRTLAALLSVALAACVNASPDVQGGEPRFDAAAPEPPAADASCGGDPNADAGDGHAFHDLYRDYFGPTGKASCTSSNTCHGSADQSGASSSEYVCAPDANGCYQGMVRGGLFLPGDKTTDPENTLLYVTLRNCTQIGSDVKMPKAPTDVYFTAADLQRIRDWLAEGAPND